MTDGDDTAAEGEGPVRRGPGGRPDAGSDPDADRAGAPGDGAEDRSGVEPEERAAAEEVERPSGPGAGEPPPEVVVALDVPGPAPARELIGRLPDGTHYKVGLELFTAAGPGFVRELTAAGHRVFLDLKLHDIPDTVAGAVRSVADLGVDLLTVHAAGGRAMVAAAADAARRATAAPDEGGLGILGVTVLTSLDDDAWEEVTGVDAVVEEAVGRLAVLCQEAGAHGVVASVGECSAVKALCGSRFRVATPGIRPEGAEAHDQKRVATPAEAADAGSDYLVVGRAVRQAADPADALRRIRDEAAGRTG